MRARHAYATGAALGEGRSLALRGGLRGSLGFGALPVDAAAGFDDTMRDLGLEHDEGLIHCLPYRDEAYIAQSAHDAVAAWYDRA